MNFFLFFFFNFLLYISTYFFSDALSISNFIKIKPIDKKIWNLAKPATLNYIMVPIVGMVDTFWVSKLGNSNELAGAGSGDQLFSIFYVLTSFLPAIITPKITELKVTNKKKETKELITTSILLTNILGIITTFSMLYFGDSIIYNFIGDIPLISTYTKDYFKIRSLGMCFCLSNSLIFSILRGFMDFNNAIKINLKSQVINIILDPIFMKFYGLKGVALASLLSDMFCTINYLLLLHNQNHFTLKINKFFSDSLILLKQGSFIQIKNTLNNFMYLYMNRKILSFDNGAKLLASNILLVKFLEMCFITFSGLYSVSNIIIPSEIIFNNDINAKTHLFKWSIIIGFIQSILLFYSQFLFPFFTNDIDIINICKKLIGFVSIYQIFYGHSYVMEGVLQGYQKFKYSGIANIITLVPMIVLLFLSTNLTQLWISNIIIIIIKCFYINKII